MRDLERDGGVRHPPGRAEHLAGGLPSYKEALQELRRAERVPGSWLELCEGRGVFQVLSREWVEALAGEMRRLGARPVLEVCAGDGGLSRALREMGVSIVATDASPPPGSWAEPVDARKALESYCPQGVLVSWPPCDWGLDRLLFSFPSLRWVIYIAPRLNGVLGSETLGDLARWKVTVLEAVDRYGLCRHDYLSDFTEGALISHSRALLFERELPEGH